MIEMTGLRVPALWAPTPAPDPALLLEQLAALRLLHAAPRTQTAPSGDRFVTWKLGSSRTPPIPRVPLVGSASGPRASEQAAHSTEPPQPARTPQGPPPLLPAEPADDVVTGVPRGYRHCGQPFPSAGSRQLTRV